MAQPGRRMNKAAFFTVVYPGVEAYLPDFFHSLAHQSCPDFDLVIGNDGLTDIPPDVFPFPVRMIDLRGTPAEIRSQGLRFLRSEGYERVIFGDSDDYFSPNRVELSLGLLDSYPVVANDLDLVDQHGRLLQGGYLSKKLGEKFEIPAGFIRDKNILGLSNTAVRVSCLADLTIPSGLVAVDWFIFSTLLERGFPAVFSAGTRTFYRQHGANTVGLGSRGQEKLLQAVRVKSLHYEAMAAGGKGSYDSLAVKFRDLYQRLLAEPTFLDQYSDYIKSFDWDPAFWWEDARLPQE